LAITTNDLKNGYVLDLDGELWTVVTFQHVKPGKGGAFVRTKLKNLAKGNTTEKTFRAGEKVERVQTLSKDMQYLYMDGPQVVLMDNETYEQISVNGEDIENLDLLAPNSEVGVLFVREAPFRVEVPTFVELTVTQTDPGMKGDTVSNVFKPAQVETGATVSVPLFINEGDRIRIDTRTREYTARA